MCALRGGVARASDAREREVKNERGSERGEEREAGRGCGKSDESGNQLRESFPRFDAPRTHMTMRGRRAPREWNEIGLCSLASLCFTIVWTGIYNAALRALAQLSI